MDYYGIIIWNKETTGMPTLPGTVNTNYAECLRLHSNWEKERLYRTVSISILFKSRYKQENCHPLFFLFHVCSLRELFFSHIFGLTHEAIIRQRNSGAGRAGDNYSRPEVPPSTHKAKTGPRDTPLHTQCTERLSLHLFTACRILFGWWWWWWWGVRVGV